MEHAGGEWRKGGAAITNEYVASNWGVDAHPRGAGEPGAGAAAGGRLVRTRARKAAAAHRLWMMRGVALVPGGVTRCDFR